MLCFQTLFYPLLSILVGKSNYSLSKATLPPFFPCFTMYMTNPSQLNFLKPLTLPKVARIKSIYLGK